MSGIVPKLAASAERLLRSLVQYRGIRTIYRALLPPTLRREMLQKLVDQGARNTRFDPLPPVAMTTPATQTPRRPANIAAGVIDGINVFGHLRGEFGLGESARLYAGALIDSGVPVALNDLPHDVPHSFGDASLGDALRQGAPYATNLVFANPEYLQGPRSCVGADACGRTTIGCWFWELETVPDAWRTGIEAVDAIFVASSFTEKAFRRVTDKPVFRVPLPLLDLESSGATRREFGLPADAFVFLVSFDFNSSIHRKNPLGAIAAFRTAFPPRRDDVVLVVKSTNGHRYPDDFSLLRDAAGKDPRILVRDEVIPMSHMRALQQCADAYVSLHRAEGFGLGLAECMAMAKPVIATAWSGNTDFMGARNSCLVDYQLIAVGDGEYPHGRGAQWAEPDVRHAARWMVRLVDEPGLATAIGEQAASDVADSLCAGAAAEAIVRAVLAVEHRHVEREPCQH
jgi:glycosyltransferase involved in cell wall biosynthesis